MASKGNLGTREKQDKWRDNIATSQILKRVENQATGKPHFIGKKEIPPMTSIDVKCAEMLLARSFPATKLIEHTGDDGGALTVKIIKFDGSNPTK